MGRKGNKNTVRSILDTRKEYFLNKLEQTTCKRCGRKLRSPTNIERGVGETCWRKWNTQNNHKKLFERNENNIYDSTL